MMADVPSTRRSLDWQRSHQGLLLELGPDRPVSWSNRLLITAAIALPLGVLSFPVAVQLIPDSLAVPTAVLGGGSLLAAGCASLAGGLHHRRDRVRFQIRGSTLSVTRQSLMGVEKREFELQNLVDVRMALYHMNRRHRHYQLRIIPRSGQPFALLDGRDEQDLRQIARLLCEQLELAHQP